MSETLSDIITGLGHASRLVEVSTPNPTVYATLYWGNQKGEGNCSECFEMPWNKDRGCWENAQVGCRILLKGDSKETLHTEFEHDRMPQNGFAYSCYCSPNEADVKLYIAAYITALNIVMPKPEERKQETLWVVAVGMVGKDLFVTNPRPLVKAEGENVYGDPEGKHRMTASGYGLSQLVDEEGTMHKAQYFASFDLTEAMHFHMGVQTGLRVLHMAQKPEEEPA